MGDVRKWSYWHREGHKAREANWTARTAQTRADRDARDRRREARRKGKAAATRQGMRGAVESDDNGEDEASSNRE